MRTDKITAITVACVLGLMFAFSGLETRAEDGLTFKEWIGIIVLAAVFGGVTGWLGYLTIRLLHPGPDDDDE